MQNEMRDRLVELIDDYIHYVDVKEWYSEELDEGLADCLIEEGNVIVPPCKVGDTVWKIEDVWHLDDRETWTYHYEKEVVMFTVRSIAISCNSKGFWTKKFRICEVRDGKIIDNQRNVEFEDFGKTVFFIREEAEKALKEREENG